MSVAVVIVDIRDSVGSKDTRAMLGRAIDVLRPLASLCQVAWGDEVEAVLPQPVDLWQAYRDVRKELDDSFYMGVGFGDIAVGSAVAPSVHELNGTAFKAARQAVERAKAMPGGHVALAFTIAGDPDLTEAASGYPSMLNEAMAAMTRRQRLYVGALIEGWTGVQIATRLGLEPSTVSVGLRRAGAAQVARLTTGMGALLRVVGRLVGWGEDVAG